MHNEMRFESATFSCKLSFLEDRRRAQGAGREQVCGPGPGRRAAAGRGERRAGGAGGKHWPSRCPRPPVNWKRLSVRGLRQQQAAKEAAGEDPGSRPHGGRTKGPRSRWGGRQPSSGPYATPQPIKRAGSLCSAGLAALTIFAPGPVFLSSVEERGRGTGLPPSSGRFLSSPQPLRCP